MSGNKRWLVSGIGVFLLVAIILVLSGCAGLRPVKSAGLEHMVEVARTRAGHQEIAAVYEQQAEDDRAESERHRGLARAYQRGWAFGSWAGPSVGSATTIRRENKKLIEHCENLVRLYQSAADEKIALARAHREIAADTNN